MPRRPSTGARVGLLTTLVVMTGSLAIALTVAGASPSDDSPHLIVVPNDDEARIALQASSARRVQTYEAFTLAEARGKDAQRLVDAGGDLRDDMRQVQIGQRNYDPTTQRVPLGAKRQAAAAKPGLAVVQFVGPVKDEWLEQLAKSGVQVVTYMAQNAELVYGDAAALNALARLSSEPHVRAITPYTLSDKLAPGIAASGRAQVVVSTVAGANGNLARSDLAARSSARGDAVTIGEITQKRVELAAADVAAIASQAGVVGVEPYVAPRLLDERAAQIVAGRLNGSHQPVLQFGYRSYLSSLGITNSFNTLDVTDSGVDKGVVPVPAGSHPDFYRSGNPANPSRIAYAQEAGADSDGRDCGGHGTNVANIAAGYNSQTGATYEDATNFNYGLGVDPYVKIGNTKIFTCAGNFDVTSSFTALRSSAYGLGARISTNSWGADVSGAYTADSREIDSLVRDAQPSTAGNQQMTNVFAAGNSGSGPDTIGAPGTGKNVITVGASENVRAIGGADGCGVPDTGANSARDVIDFSSRGPTDDGRLKPDVVAPGTHVTGAQPQVGGAYDGSGTCNPVFPGGSTLYNLVSGTSQATPEVGGMASLVRTWYSAQFGAAPSPAMTKAMIVNNTTDIAGGNDGAGGTLTNVPNQIAGWGRVNFGKVADTPPPRAVYDQVNTFGTTGAVSTRHFAISSPAAPLRVTLAFTDAPGPTSGNAYVNDLDLQVSAGGATYRGNVLVGGGSVTGGGFDPRNNLENVLLPAGISGPVTVSVIARNIAGDGVPGNADLTDQDFALIVSNAAPATTANLVHDTATITDTGGGDGDGAPEPGETISLTERLKNVGNASATGIAGTLSTSTPNTTVTAANSPWPAIAAGATGSNTTPFGVQLGAALACGTTVQLSLQVTTAGGGAYTIPIPMQTGKPSGTGTKNSTDVPKAIPDDNPAGVTSNLTLTAGILADINVKIGSLTHTFVGDLKLELIHPDGTTVVLADGVGGSGHDYTNTVFDDSAAQPIGATAAPFTGTFKPQADQLSRLNGKQMAGTWKLRITDQVAADTGTLNSWNTLTKKLACA